MVQRRQTGVVLLLSIDFLSIGLIQYGVHPMFTPQHSGIVGYLMAVGSSPVALWLGVLPLVASLVGGDSLAWDRRSGFLRYERSRVTASQLIAGKIIACALSVFCVVGAALLVTFVGSLVWLSPQMLPWHFTSAHVPTFTVPQAAPDTVLPYPTFLHGFFFAHPYLYLLLVSLMVYLSAIFWGQLALLCSVWTTNLVLVLGAPWLVYVVATFFSLGYVTLSAVSWVSLC